MIRLREVPAAGLHPLVRVGPLVGRIAETAILDMQNRHVTAGLKRLVISSRAQQSQQ